MNSTKARVRASFKPTRSAVFSLGSLALCTALFTYGVFLLSENSLIAGFVAITPSTIGGWLSYKLALMSQKDQDLDSAHPLTLTASPSGEFQLQADPRTPTEVLLEGFEAAIRIIRARKPLPEADGTVSPEGDPELDGKPEADAIVEMINEQVSAALEKFETVVSAAQPKEEEVQQLRDVPPPSDLPPTAQEPKT